MLSQVTEKIYNYNSFENKYRKKRKMIEQKGKKFITKLVSKNKKARNKNIY